MAKQPPPPEIAETPATKPKNNLLLILVVAAIAMGIGGGATWFVVGGKGGSDDAQAKASPVKPKKSGGPPVFLPLEIFTVNLQPAGSEHFLQAEITLRVENQSMVDMIKQHMPEVRNRVLLLLSSRSAGELVNRAGKEKLAEDIRIEVSRVVDPESVPEPPPVRIAKLPEPVTDGDSVAEDDAEAADEEADAEPEEAPEPTAPQVLGVLFTSFIIQ